MPHDPPDLRELVQSDERIHFGNGALEFRLVPLDQAARHDDSLAPARLFPGTGAQDGIHRLFLGVANEAAGIDEDDIGLFRGWRQGDPLGPEHRHHVLGIHEVLGAPETDEADAHFSLR